MWRLATLGARPLVDDVVVVGGQVVTAEVTTAAGDSEGYAVALADGRSVRARRLLVATGLVDELPDVPG